MYLSWACSWGGLSDRPHEQDSTCEKPPFVCPQVLAAAPVAGKPDWESQKQSGKVRSKAAKTVVCRPRSLHTCQIPKPLFKLVSSPVTPSRHHLPALPSELQ